MRKTREEKAITLIALIITIVVLLILAVVAINAVTGDGIIQHATNAKTDYEKAQTEENKTLLYYQEYLDTKGDVGPWKQDGNKIYMTNSEEETIELEIGDLVNYDATEGVTDNSLLTYTSKEAVTGVEDQTFTATNNIKWKVLGIQNGKILIISADDITINDNYYSMASVNLYLYGVNELNNICSIYGHGRGAQSARSVTVDDINKITGYDPVEKGSGLDKLNSYTNIITFESKENQITYAPTNIGDGIVRNNYGQIITDSAFQYIEDGIWKFSLPVGEKRSFKVDVYSYAASSISSSASSKEINMEMDSNSKEYKMLFQNLTNSTEADYFLASKMVKIDEEKIFTIKYGLRIVWAGGVGYVCSGGINSDVSGEGIRPVITLKSDVKLEDINNDGILEVN